LGVIEFCYVMLCVRPPLPPRDDDSDLHDPFGQAQMDTSRMMNIRGVPQPVAAPPPPHPSERGTTHMPTVNDYAEIQDPWEVPGPAALPQGSLDNHFNGRSFGGFLPQFNNQPGGGDSRDWPSHQVSSEYID